MARNYFGCEHLPYVPLENNGGRGSARYVEIERDHLISTSNATVTKEVYIEVVVELLPMYTSTLNFND